MKRKEFRKVSLSEAFTRRASSLVMNNLREANNANGPIDKARYLHQAQGAFDLWQTVSDDEDKEQITKILASKIQKQIDTLKLN